MDWLQNNWILLLNWIFTIIGLSSSFLLIRKQYNIFEYHRDLIWILKEVYKRNKKYTEEYYKKQEDSLIKFVNFNGKAFEEEYSNKWDLMKKHSTFFIKEKYGDVKGGKLISILRDYKVVNNSSTKLVILYEYIFDDPEPVEKGVEVRTYIPILNIHSDKDFKSIVSMIKNGNFDSLYFNNIHYR